MKYNGVIDKIWVGFIVFCDWFFCFFDFRLFFCVFLYLNVVIDSFNIYEIRGMVLILNICSILFIFLSLNGYLFFFDILCSFLNSRILKNMLLNLMNLFLIYF